MFEDLIKKKENWEVPKAIKLSGKIKIWGQKTLEKNKNKPVIVDIKKHKR